MLGGLTKVFGGCREVAAVLAGGLMLGGCAAVADEGSRAAWADGS